MKNELDIRKITVLLVTPIFPPKVGGASVYFSSLVDSLKKYARVLVLTTHFRNADMVEEVEEVKIFRILPFFSSFAPILRQLTTIISTTIFSTILYLRYKPKIIHVHATGSIALGIGLTSMILRMPLIMDVRDLEFKGINVLMGNLKKFIACGSTIRKRVLLYGVKDDKVLVIPTINHSLVNEVARKNIPKEQSVFSLVFVGELTEKKGVDILLQAFKKLVGGHKDFRLILIGAGQRKPVYEKLITTDGMSKKVAILSNLEYEKVLEHIAKADILVLPSFSEGNPRVILEALELGTAVIATRVGGIPEMIRSNENGVLVSPGNAEELSRAISTLIVNHKLWKTLRTNGREYIKKRNKLWSWEKMARILVQIYR